MHFNLADFNTCGKYFTTAAFISSIMIISLSLSLCTANECAAFAFLLSCRKNKFLTDRAEIAACLQEGHSRLEMALHYKIPYPRPINVPPNFVPTMKTSKTQKQKSHEAKPIYMKSLDSWCWYVCTLRCRFPTRRDGHSSRSVDNVLNLHILCII